eukprot:gnl/MRDRNA2_/MRDRNA2_34709_c0_seq1.p1 gnl/MRDRNA2_/MRDRNA2_34709_c0~~gnl/MRDRNA2_/MRDRNA2_34709_c0_seq1.p1  ORF type:complete len:632 (+),score=76.74 gnl/MRDRNA2_/MRDRNA2_34709_c0_seq1:103-1998(+)
MPPRGYRREADNNFDGDIAGYWRRQRGEFDWKWIAIVKDRGSHIFVIGGVELQCTWDYRQSVWHVATKRNPREYTLRQRDKDVLNIKLSSGKEAFYERYRCPSLAGSWANGGETILQFKERNDSIFTIIRGSKEYFQSMKEYEQPFILVPESERLWHSKQLGGHSNTFVSVTHFADTETAEIKDDLCNLECERTDQPVKEQPVLSRRKPTRSSALDDDAAGDTSRADTRGETRNRVVLKPNVEIRRQSENVEGRRPENLESRRHSENLESRRHSDNVESRRQPEVADTRRHSDAESRRQSDNSLRQLEERDDRRHPENLEGRRYSENDGRRHLDNVESRRHTEKVENRRRPTPSSSAGIVLRSKSGSRGRNAAKGKGVNGHKSRSRSPRRVGPTKHRGYEDRALPRDDKSHDGDAANGIFDDDYDDGPIIDVHLKVVGGRTDAFVNLRGSYARVDAELGDRPIFQRVIPDPDAGSPSVFVYFRDDEDNHGWWIGRRPGSSDTWAFHPIDTDLPPKTGWVVPQTNQVDATMRICVTGGQCTKQAMEAEADLWEWLLGLDQGAGDMLPYFPKLLKEYDGLARISSLWRQHPGSRDRVDPEFFDILGITKLGHKFLFLRGISKLQYKMTRRLRK